EQGQQAGYGEQELARALMTEVLAVYKRGRTPADIAHELNFLAENLDEDQDYASCGPERAQRICTSMTPSALTWTSASPPSTAGVAISMSAAIAIMRPLCM